MRDRSLNKEVDRVFSPNQEESPLKINENVGSNAASSEAPTKIDTSSMRYSSKATDIKENKVKRDRKKSCCSFF